MTLRPHGLKGRLGEREVAITCLRSFARLIVVMETDQTLRVRNGKETQQDSVHHAENGRVGADAEGQRNNGGGRERRTLCQHPGRKAQILQHRVHVRLLLFVSKRNHGVHARGPPRRNV